jgi:hypothetical protein
MGLGLGLGFSYGIDTFASILAAAGPTVDVSTNGFFEDAEVILFREDGIYRWNPYTNTMGSAILAAEWTWQGCYDHDNEVIWYFHSTTGNEAAIDEIRKINVDGTGKTTVFTDGAGGANWDPNAPRSMVYDSVNDRIYFVDGAPATNNRVLEFTTDGTTVVPDSSTPYISGGTNADDPRKLYFDGVNERLYVGSDDDFEVNIFDISTQATPSFIKAITESGAGQFQGACVDMYNDVVYIARFNATTPVRAWSYATATRYLLGDCGGVGSAAFGDVHFCHGRGCVLGLASPGTYGTKFDVLWPNHPMENSGNDGNVLQATINTITGTGDRATGLALVPATTWDSNPYPIRLDEFALGTPVLYYLKDSDLKIYSNDLALGGETAVSASAYGLNGGAAANILVMKFDHVANMIGFGQQDAFTGQAVVYDIGADTFTQLSTPADITGICMGVGFGGSARPWGMSGFNHPFNDVGDMVFRNLTRIDKRIYDASAGKVNILTLAGTNWSVHTFLSGWNGRNFILYYGRNTNPDMYRSASTATDPWSTVGVAPQISNNQHLEGPSGSINVHCRWPELVTIFKNGGDLGVGIPDDEITATAVGLWHTASGNITRGATAANAGADLTTALSVSGTVYCVKYDPVNEMLYWTDDGGFKKCAVSMYEGGTTGNYVQPIVGTPTTISGTPGFKHFVVDWKFEDGSSNDLSLAYHGEYP